MERITTLSLMERIPDEKSAWEYLEQLRWNGTPVCPHCGNDERCYFLNPANGARTTSTGATTYRRLWKCGACRKQFSVLTGTIMHGSKIPVRTWIMVVFEMASNKNGVAGREIERRYGLTPKSAWFMLQRIREAMRNDGLGMLGGVGRTVVADETFIGGKPRFKHQQGRPARMKYGRGLKTGPRYEKTAVLSLIDKTTGEVRSRVVPDVTGATLRKAIAEQVDMPNTVLHTDGAYSYKSMRHEVARHEYVDHLHHEYVRGDVSTNQAENFFSQLKRSLDGTHHHVSRVHLHRYLGEFDFRHSTKRVTDTERMRRMIDQAAGQRLSYDELTDRRP